MSDIQNIYGHNITDLLIDNERTIDEHDRDFDDVLTSLQHLSVSNRRNEANTESNRSQIDENREVAFDSTLIQIQKHIFSSYEHNIYLQTSYPEELCVKKFERKKTFPKKLFTLLEQSDTDGYSHIISWLPYGNAFKIHDEKLFEKYVLNKHFRSKLESFKRQLYVYGFKKISKRCSNSGAYFHEHFLRSQQDSSIKVSRWNNTKSKSIYEVPNFDKVPRTLRNLN